MGISDQILYECVEGKEHNGAKTARFGTLARLMGMMGGGFFLYLAAIIAMSVSMSLFSTITAYLLKNLISMARLKDMTGLWMLVLKNVCAGIGVLFVYQLGFICYTLEAKKGGARLQKTVLGKAMRLPFSYYENTHSGDFMSKLIYDEERAQDIYGSRFRRILMPSIMVVCYLIPMFALNWQVTACLLITSILTFLANALFIKPMRKVSSTMSDTHMSLTERLSNILAGMEQVKMFNLDKKLVGEYVESNDRFLKGQRKMNVLTAALEGLNNFFDLLGSLIFIAVGIYFVGLGITSVENIAAIYVLFGIMSWNFLQIGIYIPSMASCLVNADRVFTFLDQEEEPACYSHVEKAFGNGYIEMEAVNFAYDGKVQILKDFNLHVEKGRTIALKGASGKGKSTIAKLLLGFYPIQSGRISIDGRAMKDMSLEELRSMIGYVPQEPYLYDVSILENIRYGRPDATKEEIIRAAKAANAHEFIMKQEKGYGTPAGERGNRLSGGEKQRIAIARAILKNAPILILDEATSALDNESERLVSEALGTLMENRTTIMIAHRPSTLSRADEIIEV